MKITKLSLESYLHKTTNIFFLLLYPGFVIYNMLLLYGVVPVLPTGYFPLFSLLYLLAMTPVAYFLFGSPKSSFYTLITVCMFSLVLLVALLNYLFVEEWYIGPAFKQFFESFALLLLSMVMGYWLRFDGFLYKYSRLFIFVAFIFAAWFVVSTGNVMFYARALAQDAEGISTYQGFARSIAVVGIVLLAYQTSVRRIMLYGSAVVLLLMVNGARSEMLGFSFAFIVIGFFATKNIQNKILFVVFGLLVVLAVFFGSELFLEGNRVFQLKDLKSASSWQARQYLQDVAVEHIKGEPLFGMFGGHVNSNGSIGSYSHNILSLWAGFGLIPFLLYLLMLLVPLVVMSKLFLDASNVTTALRYCFMIGCFSVLLLFFAKSFYWFVPGLYFGAYMSIRNSFAVAVEM